MQTYLNKTDAKIKNGKLVLGDHVRIGFGDVVAVYHELLKRKIGTPSPGTSRRTTYMALRKSQGRNGVVIGFRRVNCNEAKSASDKTWVLLVCYHPTLKPVLVRPEDVMVVREWTGPEFVRDPTASEAMKGEFRDHPGMFPRDEKGRFIP